MARGGGVEHDGRVRHGLDLLHELGKRHGLVDTGDRGGDLGEEGLGLGVLKLLRDLGRGVDLHGKEVVEAGHKGGLGGELLAEGVGEVVRGVRGDEEDGLAVLGELGSEGAARGGLTDTTLATDEDPAEGLGVDDVLQGGVHNLVSHVGEGAGLQMKGTVAEAEGNDEGTREETASGGEGARRKRQSERACAHRLQTKKKR